MTQPLRPAIFIDKDGTLLDDVPWNVDPLKMRLAPGALDALRLFSWLELPIFVISNQSGVALGKFDLQALDRVEARLRELAAEAGASFAGIYWCPHHPRGVVPEFTRACECRKPAPGLLLRAAREHGIDLSQSWFIGDILDDVEAGHRAGCRSALIDNGNETEWLKGVGREPDIVAKDLYEAAIAVVNAECPA
ncbi:MULTISPECIES: HAD family hydrolase [Caballeronia]|jgi:histidinol-phosphate phosphatase family protein|uniref:D-glycero-alpha-D-manno-heptose-1,7-bisphosphate 7-phosphatase n=1 Tax=Caballeronia TaxID=1827195 RepID=UPI00025B9D4F|nr:MULTISPECIES: HAD family hydrolase [Caballeronia]EKS71281.1 hydrolase, HAD-superfamily, subfamily IIIA [Burkholderia sp. SJ98]MCG7403992.1 HAD family hydrolase [Caballeronia zhejiangensis]MCI1045439.1 HAD family hydrolase [Caballeronia zhejiangensis]MDR5769309.1 HAD family hydrolase [Caballeronia sp. LZ028]MDR5790664.1 HAD family hydrolase [Caballeronia sp. LP003]